MESVVRDLERAPRHWPLGVRMVEDFRDTLRKGLGCMGMFVALAVLGSLAQCMNNASDENDIRKGPIPRKFQGAYNTVSCGSANMDGLITIGGKHMAFPSATFTADEVVTKSDRSVTLRGSASGIGWREAERVYTITLSEDGESVQIGSTTAERCSKY
jgi:hypothetical protein